MGGRYLCSGTDLGEIIALISTDPVAANKKVNEIIEKQFVCESKVPISVDIDILKNLLSD